MDVHPPKNGIFIGIDPYPYPKKQKRKNTLMGKAWCLFWALSKVPTGNCGCWKVSHKLE